MKWFYDLPFRWKLAIPVFLLAVVILTMALTGVRNLEKVVSGVDVLSKKRLPEINFLLQADRDLYQAQVAERSLLVLDPGSSLFTTMLEQHSENIQQAHDRIRKYQLSSDSPKTQIATDNFFRLYGVWRDTTRKVVQLLDNDEQGSSDTAKSLSYGASNQEFDAMRSVIDELTELVELEAAEEISEIDKTAASSRALQIMILVVGFAICLGVGFIFPTVVATPLARLLDRMEDISHGEGDLTLRLDNTGKDELGRLSAAFNAFLEKLHSTISQVTGSTLKATVAADQLAEVTNVTTKNVSEQHKATDQVAAAINEMTATVQEVAKNASEAAEAAGNADSSAEEGQRIVNESIESIQDLAGSIDEASEVIKTLEKQCANIGGVLDVIGSIAEQTNLLALNAAIEAARAGEQGRGFAVVADEVRTLAGRTQESTLEIQGMIERLQRGSSDAVRVMDIGRGKVEISVSRATGAGESLERITRAVASIAGMNLQIATAAEEQSSVTEDINRNIMRISEISDSSSEGSDVINAASVELAGLASTLEGQVRQFKIT